MYKLSKYLVFSEPIIKANYRLVYSTLSTSLTLLKIDVFEKLMAQKFDNIDIEHINKLEELNIIVDKNLDELNAIIQENKIAIEDENMLYQVISPSANCQLGCDYCGQVHSKDLLDDDMNDKIIKRVSNNLSQKKFKELHIGWFGAEPLMGLKNIKKLTDEFKKLASEYDCVYSAKMVTNGLSLKRNIFFDLVQNYSLIKFEITLDGTETHHDLRRHTKNKEKTFELIYKNLKEIVTDERFDAHNCSITIRCNVDTSNYKSTFDLISRLEEDGILNKISFYTAPIHSWGNDAHLKSLSHQEYADFQIETFIDLLEKKHPMTILPGAKTHIVCTSLYEFAEVFDAHGDVYNCTEISQVPAYENDDSYKLGKLYDDSYQSETKPYKSWNDDILNEKVPCSDCEILPICGGACPKLWLEGISPCPPIKYNIENRLLLEFSKNKDKYINF
jgi:uncharacterized protein